MRGVPEVPENFIFYHKYNTRDAAWVVAPKCDIIRQKCDAGQFGSTRLVDTAGLVRMCQDNKDPGCETPPKSGWQYWDWGYGKWKQDVSLELLYNYAELPCAQLEVSHNDIAIDIGNANYYRKEWNEILGTYNIQPGRFSLGRPTYRRQDGCNIQPGSVFWFSLLVAERSSNWEILKSDYTGSEKVLVQSGKGTLRPDDAGPSITDRINDWRNCKNLTSGCPDPGVGWYDAEQPGVIVKCVKKYQSPSALRAQLELQRQLCGRAG